MALRHHPIMLGKALLAYGLGLRRAAGDDPIAAIDNVTRKMMREGQRPMAVIGYRDDRHDQLKAVQTGGSGR